jgi:hypothetical protein
MGSVEKGENILKGWGIGVKKHLEEDESYPRHKGRRNFLKMEDYRNNKAEVICLKHATLL